MRTALIRRHVLRAVAPAALTLALTLTGTLASGSSPAYADTGYGKVSDVYMNLGPTASPSQQGQYSQLIASLRSAAGHGFRGNVGVTQTVGNALIRMRLTSPSGNTVTLWFTPGDLYLRGFTAANDVTWQFNDGDFSLVNLMDSLGVLQAGMGRSLNFGSNYNSMTQRAGRGRENMPMHYADFTGSVDNLATFTTGGNQQAAARSLMFLIQVTSEAARFNDVYGTGLALTVGNGVDGLPLQQQYLENSWAHMSSFAYSVSQNPNTAPVDITGVGRLTDWNSVARYLALLIGNLNLPQEGQSGDWNHTEL
ncbi:ribosome-inactivating family protein [Streptomyces sp. NPDC047017]|uniref:ribosome-inactivating family protein n=1 Tax=Streptomyces sp. NPDC047017 TaxID=3155024 RepID=UPI0033C5A4FF